MSACNVIKLAFVACALGVFPGCSLWYGTRPACPLASLKAVAVLPVIGAPAGKEEEFGDILASELVQFPGIERIVLPEKAEAFRRRLGLDRYVVQDLRTLARELEVDGVLAPELYQFDVHDPPRAVIWCALVTRSGAGTDPRYPLRLVRRGTLPAQAGPAPAGTWTLTRVFDAGAHSTADDIVLYSLSREKASYGLGRVERVTRIGSEFFRYVSDRTIRQLFYLIKESAPYDRKKGIDRELVHREG